MSFSDLTIDTYDSSKSKFKRAEFKKITPGQHLIRILFDKPPLKVYVHWVNGINLVCPDNECPVCERNKRIRVENPNDYMTTKGYSSRRQLFHMNILDKSTVKKCPSCDSDNEAVNGVYSSTCYSCNTPIIEVIPTQSLKYKVLVKGSNLFDQFKTLSKTVRDVKGEPVQINTYDITLNAIGSGRNMNTIAVPQVHLNEPLEVDMEQVVPIEDVPIYLTSDELAQSMRGVHLKDIFAARRAVEEADSFLENEAVEVSSEAIKERAEALFDA